MRYTSERSSRLSCSRRSSRSARRSRSRSWSRHLPATLSMLFSYDATESFEEPDMLESFEEVDGDALHLKAAPVLEPRPELEPERAPEPEPDPNRLR